jgi:hypothetical protein
MVCVLPAVGQARVAIRKRKFRTFTRDFQPYNLKTGLDWPRNLPAIRALYF